MEIRTRPEVEALIRQDVQRGAYQRVDEFVEHAVRILPEQEVWLADHRAQIEAQVREAAARRGELIDADEVRSKLNELKNKPMGEQHRG